MGKLDVIILGAGKAGADFHLASYKEIEQVEVVAVCDPNIDLARSVCESKGVPNAYPSLEEALTKHKPDIVSVCSPPRFHLEQAKKAFDAGAHVLMEKPIAETLEEALEMESYGRLRDRKLQVVHNMKFRPGWQEALRMVREGAIGDILHIEHAWLRNGAGDRMVVDKDFWCHKLDGGRWAEALPHRLYIPYQFVGPMRLCSVRAKDVHGRWPWLPGDEVLITLETDRATLTIRISANSETEHKNMVIYGSKGMLYCNSTFVTTLTGERLRSITQFLHGTKGLATWPWRYLRGKLGLPGGIGTEALRVGEDKPGHWSMVNGFVDHLLRGAPEPVPWEEAYWTMRTTHEIGKAIEADIDRERLQ